MNNLAFNPSQKIIEQWRDIYLNFDEIQEFEVLIDKLYISMEGVESHKNQRNKGVENRINFKGDVEKDIKNNLQSKSIDNFITKNQIQSVSERIEEIQQLKEKFLKDYTKIIKQRKFILPDKMTGAEFMERQRLKYRDPEKYNSIAYSRIDFGRIIILFETHLIRIEKVIIQFYTKYVLEQDHLIAKFTAFKQNYLNKKIRRFNELVKSILQNEQKAAIIKLNQESYLDIKTLYENLFIQTDYLYKLVHYNSTIFQKFEEDHESSFEYLKEIRIQHKNKMKKLQQTVQILKNELRTTYVSLFKPKKSQLKDPNRLEKIICSEVAINADQFQQTTNSQSFINGVFFSVLLFSLIGILVFRSQQLSKLQQNKSYLTQFKIWRGASYLIFFNWVIGIVLFLFDHFKINYRLVLLQSDTFVPKPQAFLRTAVTLSAIYLILFIIYLFKAVGIIEGHDLLQHLGYFMWLINLCFLLNPIKIMNYEGRRYFIQLLAKVLVSIFRPMNLNIFLVAMIMGSFVQPFTDLAFTACNLAYKESRDCLQDTRIATFVYTIVFLTIRFGHSIRSHLQLNTSQRFTKPILGLIAVVCSTNNVVSSYLYNTYSSNGLLIYWIISAIIATFAGLNADVRADWGLLSYDEQDCFLRKYKRFPRPTYFILVVIDFFLNVGWVFSVSNNLSFADAINPIYFLMVLSYIELSRKGLWIFFRVEDDHSANVGSLNALLSDEFIYQRLIKRHQVVQQKNIQKNDTSSEIIKENHDNVENSAKQKAHQVQSVEQNKSKAIPSLEDLQKQIIRKNEYVKNVNAYKEELTDYLDFIHQTYKNLEWDNQY